MVVRKWVDPGVLGRFDLAALCAVTPETFCLFLCCLCVAPAAGWQAFCSLAAIKVPEAINSITFLEDAEGLS